MKGSVGQNANVIPIREGVVPQSYGARLPAQLNLFTGKPEPVRVPVEEEWEDVEIPLDEGITLVQNSDKSQLLISGHGIFLGKVSERLVVKTPSKNKRIIYEVPFFRLSEVVIASRGVTISSDLVEELSKRGIPIHFIQSNGRPYALVASPMLTAVVKARREQINALNDERSFKICRTIVEAKTANQASLLQYFGKYLRKVNAERFERISRIVEDIKAVRSQVGLLKANNIQESRAALMGLEGAAGRLYWVGVKEIVEEKETFMGRVTRGASDVVNALLNYGYGILYTQVWGAVVLAGLEPFAGFMHVDRPGKPSLVLDLVEEFRQPIVDRTVIASINLGRSFNMEGGLLDVGSRKEIAEKILERLESREVFDGKRYQVRSIIQMQSRRLAGFLKGEREYKPYRFKW
jgi:CRISPR-associated protein Cas1